MILEKLAQNKNKNPDLAGFRDLPFYSDAMNALEKHPEKGLLLIGGVGVGKTTFLRLTSNFQVFSCDELSMKFSARGYDVIEKHIKNDVWEKAYYAIYDDLGTEPIESVYMGNRLNLMQFIIERRYDHFKAHGLKTHITTNLTLKEIQSRYGERVYSRLKEMVSVITINGTDLRGSKLTS